MYLYQFKLLQLSMSSSKKFYLIIFYFIAIVLFLGVFTIAKMLSPENLFTSKILQTISIASISIIVISFLKKFVWNNYETINNKKPPKLLVDILNIIIIFIAIIIISKGVFSKSVFSFITAGGLLTTAIIWALQDFVKDVFSGAILDIESPYKVGDWLRLDDKIDGEVVRIDWRTTTIHTVTEEIIHLPNSYFTKNKYGNLSRPNRWYWSYFTIDLDFEIPIDRACRIMASAAVNSNLLYNKNCQVYAKEIIGANVRYIVRHAALDKDIIHEARHEVLSLIISELKDNNIELSHYLGEYSINQKRNNIEKIDETPDKKEIIKSVDLFEKLSEEYIEKIIKNSKDHFISQRKKIVSQGDEGSSIYIIAEGVAEVLVTKESIDIETSLVLLKKGDYFGERALFLGDERNATVIAKSDILIYEIPREIFMPIIEEMPSALEHLSYVIAKRDASRLKSLDETSISEKKDEITTIFNAIKKFFGSD